MENDNNDIARAANDLARSDLRDERYTTPSGSCRFNRFNQTVLAEMAAIDAAAETVGTNTYLTTVKDSGSANVCASGNLLSKMFIDVVVGKINRLEVYRVKRNHIQQLTEIWLYEQTEILKVFPSKDENKDFIFILTSKYNAMILECIQTDDEFKIITRSHSNIYNESLIANRFLCSINSKARIIGLQLFEGLFHVVPMDQEGHLKMHTLKMEEQRVRTFEFLNDYNNPTVIMITESVSNAMRSKVGTIRVKQLFMHSKRLVEVSLRQENVSASAKTIICLPQRPYGAIILSNEAVVHHNGSAIYKRYPNKNIYNIKCCTSAKANCDGTQYLLGDEDGHLFMLYIIYDVGNNLGPKNLKLTYLGEISIPSSFTQAGEDQVYVASTFGDSQFIEYHFFPFIINPKIGSNILKVIKKFVNLGPIVNMCLADTEQRGQNDIFTCSGVFKHGCIKRLRNEIRFQELASIDLVGIKGIWSLSLNNSYNLDDTLVLSFIEYCKVLSFNNNGVEEIEFGGFQTELQTLYCGNTKDNKIIQITTASVRLLCWATETLLSEWIAPDSKKIDIVTCNDQQVVCAMANRLYHIAIGSEVVQIGDITLEQEVSCLDVYSFIDKFDKHVNFVAVGLWMEVCVKIFQLPNFVETTSIHLNEILMPRSISLVTLENKDYLFCTIGNGTLYSFNFYSENGTLCEIHKMKPSNQPALLRKFQSHSTTNVFTCLANDPVIINSSGDKLIFSNIAINKVNTLCSLNTEKYPNSLALATDTSIIIGIIDKKKSLNVCTVPLGDSPKGIVHQEASKSFGVITVKTDVSEYYNIPIQPFSASASTKNTSSGLQNYRDKYPAKTEKLNNTELREYIATKYRYEFYNINFSINHMIILHHNSFKVLHAYQLFDHECALSITSTKLGNDPSTYYILGTGFAVQEIDQFGRVIIFHFDDSSSKLTQIDQRELNGACNCLVVNNDKIILSVKRSIQIYSWKCPHLTCENIFMYNNIILYIEPKQSYTHFGNSFLLHGQFKTNPIKDETNFNMRQTSAIEMIDEKYFIITDGTHLYTFKKEKIPLSDRFIEFSRFNLGDGITVFKHGSLVKESFIDTNNMVVSTQGNVFFGTYSGTLGLITQINPVLSHFLCDLQKSLTTANTAMDKHMVNIRNVNVKGYFDGSLIENFLNLSKTEMNSILAGLEGSYDSNFRTISTKTEIGVEDLIKFVKHLTHLPLDCK